jgi:DNA-binding CsgD family transcriptional regulator
MRYFTLFFYILSCSTSFASLFMAIVSFIKFRNKTFLYYILFLFDLTLLLFLENFEYFRVYFMNRFPSFDQIFRILLYNCSYSVMYYLMPLILYSFLEKRFSFVLKIPFFLLSIVAVALTFIPSAITETLIDFWRVSLFCFKSVNWIFIFIFSLTFVISLLNYKKISQSGKKIILKTFFAVAALFIPLFILEFLWNNDIQRIYFLGPISSLNFLYFTINLIFIIIAGKSLYFKSDQPVDIHPTESFLEKYGITEREREMIIFLAKGYSNKQIASMLYISSITVKNHIYNIYKKTRVQSRVELMNKMLIS